MTVETRPQYTNLLPGDPAPWFKQRCGDAPAYVFDSVAGRYVVLCFFGSAQGEPVQAQLALLKQHRALFDDDRIAFFGVSVDQADKAAGRLEQDLPGIRYFEDYDQSVSRLYGAVPREVSGETTQFRQFWLVLDPMLRVVAGFPIYEGERAMSFLRQLPDSKLHLGFEVGAPILVLPRVFEPQFCQRLIEAYEAEGGAESGFMREIDGRTVQVMDHGFKRRKDFNIQDPALIREVQARIARRVAPELQKVYSFTANRMERYMVGCYAQEDGGHFRPHRDNTTKGTAHRRFAVSINLNGDFAGGELSFPEFGPRTYKAPPGAALIFPGAILHAVSQVTSGKRYAFLPFVYDDAAARIREQNAQFIDGAASGYKSGLPVA